MKHMIKKLCLSGGECYELTVEKLKTAGPLLMPSMRKMKGPGLWVVQLCGMSHQRR